MSCLFKACNNLKVQYQRSSWNLTNLLVNFWIMCHDVVFSIPILLSRRLALYSLHLVILLNLCFICESPFSSLILTLHYHYFLILLVTVILVSMIVILGLLVQLGFHTHPKILNTIFQLVLIEFVILNGWFPTIVYLWVWLGLSLLLVDNSDPYFLLLFFRMLEILLWWFCE